MRNGCTTENYMTTEKYIRSLTKAYCWRVFGSTITVIISYIFTHKIEISLGIGATEVLVKPLAYFLYERIWLKIKWGKI